MNGYTYGDAPVERCPYCGSVCEADWVDVGVGVRRARRVSKHEKRNLNALQ